jgi:hypothetical protein
MVYTPYLLPSAVSALLLLGLALFALRFRRLPAGLPFAVAMSSVAFWAVVYSLELASTDLQTKIVLAELRFVGIGPMVAAWLLTSLHHAGKGGAFRGPWLALLFVEPVATAALSLSSGLHRLFP